MTEFYVDKQSLKVESTLFITGTGNLHSIDNQTHCSFFIFIFLLRVFFSFFFCGGTIFTTSSPGLLGTRHPGPRKERWERGWPSCCASHPNTGSCSSEVRKQVRNVKSTRS